MNTILYQKVPLANPPDAGPTSPTTTGQGCRHHPHLYLHHSSYSCIKRLYTHRYDGPQWQRTDCYALGLAPWWADLYDASIPFPLLLTGRQEHQNSYRRDHTWHTQYHQNGVLGNIAGLKSKPWIDP